MNRNKKIIVTSDASGAWQAAREGMLVMIVDVIDMSTALESALDAGAFAVLGASPDVSRAPVRLNPEKVGREAVILAKESGSGIILLAEPRAGTEEERIARCQKVIRTIEAEHGLIEAILPNIGAETPKMADMKNRVVLAVTDTGGVAYDAAFSESHDVITGTVARTFGQKGIQPAMTAVRRAQETLKASHSGIAVVAASCNSMEDILAAQFISNLLLNKDL